ncbi:hypothetical protein BYT27DRAFT_7195199 [Phlegmacium glaucopus]|nr:hypothetical protein BYT27DRAFT_7195199 [Phlegmacium glaucopus]
MTLITCGQRRIPTLWRLFERNLSTKSHPAATSQVNVSSQTTLPAPKMRALISLYHQADSWVTPENLLQKIDEAFVPSDAKSLSPATTDRIENMVSVSDMKNSISLMRNAPKMAQWDSSSPGGEGRYSPSSEWSESGKNKRDLKVIEALYGVEAITFDHDSTYMSQPFLPGLEVLQESASAAIQDHEDDREAEDLRDLLRPDRL